MRGPATARRTLDSPAPRPPCNRRLNSAFSRNTSMTDINAVTTLVQDGDVAVITLNSPPVNALSFNVRDGLYEGFKQAIDSDAKAIVLVCDGRTFIAGADITEFGGPQRGASLFEVQGMME